MILYSFRRCPYAIRARLALLFAEQHYTLCEVSLKNKPPEMLVISPKGTVPVLQLDNGGVIEESLDICLWALQQADPQQLLPPSGDLAAQLALIEMNDNRFKYYLDRYKYADRYLEQSALEYRQQGEIFLGELEQRLQNSQYLYGNRPSLADIAIMPFIRQFSMVEPRWWMNKPYAYLWRWLDEWLTSAAFTTVMAKVNHGDQQ